MNTEEFLNHLESKIGKESWTKEEIKQLHIEGQLTFIIHDLASIADEEKRRVLNQARFILVKQVEARLGLLP